MAESRVIRQPQRSCVGCRRREAKANLVRIVVSGTQMIVDKEARLPGRGAYLHPRLGCLELAFRRRAFARAFRTQVPLDDAGVREFLT